MKTYAVLLSSLLALCTVAFSLEKAPVPDAAAQKEAEKMIRDLFKAEYAQSAPADKLALAASGV